jgi:hypothetical protein
LLGVVFLLLVRFQICGGNFVLHFSLLFRQFLSRLLLITKFFFHLHIFLFNLFLFHNFYRILLPNSFLLHLTFHLLLFFLLKCLLHFIIQLRSLLFFGGFNSIFFSKFRIYLFFCFFLSFFGSFLFRCFF